MARYTLKQTAAHYRALAAAAQDSRSMAGRHRNPPKKGRAWTVIVAVAADTAALLRAVAKKVWPL